MNTPLEELARLATQGSKAALEELVERIRDDVYRLAFRMLGHPADAEDAAQEILLKVITHLGTFRGESSLCTWVFHVASNHLISMRRGRHEPEAFSFEALEERVMAGLAADLPPPDTPESALLSEEVKLGCTQAMLHALDRDHRLAYLLGEVFELSGEEGAEVLEISPAAFRKRLSRARERIAGFMTRTCGLVSPNAPCRCRRQVGPCTAAGLLKPQELVFAVHPARARQDARLWEYYEEIESVHRGGAVFRGLPAYTAPVGLIDTLRQLIATSRL